MRRRRPPRGLGWPDERTSMVDALRFAHEARHGGPLLSTIEQPPPQVGPQLPADPTAWILRLARCGPVGIVETELPALLKAAYTQGRHDAVMDCLARERIVMRRYRNAAAAARTRRKVLERSP